ncbi:hypothetical protein GJ629_00210 [Halapricum sp. CBA1109]|nr:hypothetical protein [Halapricum sp. CBA1109]
MSSKARSTQLLKRSVMPLLFVALAMLLIAQPVAAQPVGGGGGSSGDFLDILNRAWEVVYDSMQFIGLAVLGLGLVVYFTARNNSNRSETGMKLAVGGGVLTVAYFGMAAIIAVLEYVATP